MQDNELNKEIEREIETESQQNLDPQQLYENDGGNQKKRDIVMAMARLLIDVAEQNKEIIELLKELIGDKRAEESTEV